MSEKDKAETSYMTRYFWITGILAIVSFIPGAVAFSSLLIIPGLILIFSPMLFLYPMAFKISLKFISAKLPNYLRYLLGLISMVAMLSIIPAVLNLFILCNAWYLQRTDKSVSAPLVLKEVTAILSDDISGCAELCQRLLYSGSTKWVIVGRFYSLDKTKLNNPEGVYYISHQDNCPYRIKKEEFSSAVVHGRHEHQQVIRNESIKERIVAGDCLVGGMMRLSKADIILTERNLAGYGARPVEAPRLGNVKARRLAVVQNVNGRLDVLDRKTQVQADFFIMPLVIAFEGGFDGRQTVARKNISLNSYVGGDPTDDDTWSITPEHRRLFGEAVK